MATESALSKLARLARLAEARYIDHGAEARARDTGEVLWSVGGRWDVIEQRYAGPSAAPTVWTINRAQIAAARAIGQYIAARRADSQRVAEICLYGGRGSGKTHLGILALYAIAIGLPDSRCLLISPANTRRAELVRIIRDQVPKHLRGEWSERNFTHSMLNGSTVQYVGADDEDALKQGGFEVALFNEAHLCTSTAYAYAVGGIRNMSGRPRGLLIPAWNHATKERGAWTEEHLEKYESGSLDGATLAFELDPRLNTSIAADTVDVTDRLIRSVDTRLADADILGIRRRIGEMAVSDFRPWPRERMQRLADGRPAAGHLGTPPDIGWCNVTAEFTAARREIKRPCAVILGVDFNLHPHCVADVVEVYEREDATRVYYARDCILSDGSEDALAQRMREWLTRHGLTPRDAWVIADSSGAGQNIARDMNGKKSHEILREWGFTVSPAGGPARDPRNVYGAAPNPDVEDTLQTLGQVCDDDRLLVNPAASWLVECLRKGKVRRNAGRFRMDDRPPGYSHAIDGIRYVVHVCEPPRGGPRLVPEYRSGVGGSRRM